MNEYESFERSLVNGSLSHNSVQIAYRAWLRKRTDIPNEIKDILSGKKHSHGIIGEAFLLLSHIIGGTELAFRRGYQAGKEDFLESQK